MGFGRGGGRVVRGPVPVRRVLSPVRAAEWGRREERALAAIGRLARLACGGDVEEERARVLLGRAVLAVRRAGRLVREADAE